MAEKFFIATFGCRTNQADSAALRESFEQSGLAETDDPRGADIIIVNSCTVTHRSDQQVRQLARRLHRENPTARIAVTGCYAQRSPDVVAEITGITAVVGNTRKEDLVQILTSAEGPPPDRIVGQKTGVFHNAFERDHSLIAAPPGRPGGRTIPFVKLQDGCDAKCSYCIIPTVRGPSRSVPPDEIVAQVERLAGEGIREIALTGIHIGTYGMHFSPRIPLDLLLMRLLSIPGTCRFRLSSIEPMELSRRVIDLAAASDRLAPHFHICLQSGSDRILKLMRRPYTTRRFQGILEEIRNKLPVAGIGTDLIVGFPGETEEDHRATVAFIDSAPFTYLHVFPYSGRPGTEAEFLPGKVPAGEIKRRAEEIRQLGDRKEESFGKKSVGTLQRLITLGRVGRRGREALTGSYLPGVVPPEVPANRLYEGLLSSFSNGLAQFASLRPIG